MWNERRIRWRKTLTLIVTLGRMFLFVFVLEELSIFGKKEAKN